jgi:hypothetical protein
MPLPIRCLSNLFFTWRKTHIIEKSALDVARQCRTILFEQIINNAKKLAPRQVPGYVRAYATCCIEPIIKSRIDLKHLSPIELEKVVSQAKDHLIEMITSDMRSMPPAFMTDIAAAA